MKKSISENEFIKNSCRIECKWEQDKKRWVIKINHITDEIAYSNVRVTMSGFENFQTAYNEATTLFKRNLRNQIKDNQTIHMNFTTDDIWPEYLTEKI